MERNALDIQSELMQLKVNSQEPLGSNTQAGSLRLVQPVTSGRVEIVR